MSGSSARGSLTYSGNDTIYTVPDNTDATVTGTGDTLQLGSGDTVLASGADTMVAGASAAGIELRSSGDRVSVQGGTIRVDTGAAGTVLSGTGTVTASTYANDLTLAAGADYAIEGPSRLPIAFRPGSSAVIDAPSPRITVTDSGPYSYLFQSEQAPAAASFRVLDPVNAASGVSSEIEGYSGPGATGNRVSDTLTFTDGSSDVITPGSGAYGIFLQRDFFGAGGGEGVGFGQIYDVVNGSSVLVLGPTDEDPAPTEQITYSSLDATGSVVRADIDNPANDPAAYGYGLSEMVRPAGGGFGIFRTVSDWSGAQETGTQFATSYDIVNGQSVSRFLADGAFGIYRADVTTSGWDASGNADVVSLQVVNGSSVTFTPIAGGSSWHEVTTTGSDGSGHALQSATVTPHDVASVFETLTGQLFPDPSGRSIPLDLDVVGNGLPTHTTVGPSGSGGAFAVTLADFSATKSSGAGAVSTAPSSGSVSFMPDVARAVAVLFAVPGHASVLPAKTSV